MAASTAASRLAQQDKGNWFAEMHSPSEHGVKLGGPIDRPQPWPTDAAARLLWLAALPEGSVWMPTPSEQDQQAQEYLAELSRDRKGRFAVAAPGARRSGCVSQERGVGPRHEKP